MGPERGAPGGCCTAAISLATLGVSLLFSQQSSAKNESFGIGSQERELGESVVLLLPLGAGEDQTHPVLRSV